ncbi:TIM barrel protein [Candidatus Poribacteria bacterium]|nr:TIM barrel protein [Candidatus Poribacteria bacterium]
MNFSATTVMLPHLDLQQTCKLLSKLGFNGVELRVRRLALERANEAPSSWGRHLTDLSPENIMERADEVKSVTSENGLQIPGFASACQNTDIEQIKLLSEGAKAVGCPAIRLSCPGYNGSVNYHELYDEAVKGYTKALEITREYGIKVLVEMHGGTIHPSASLAYRIVSNFDAEDIGVIYDPQNMVKDGFETIQLAMELLGDYLAHIHAGGHKPYPTEPDEKGTVKWAWSGCPMAEGLYDFPKMIECLRKVDFQGFISIEDFRGDVSPEEKLDNGIKYLSSL